MFGPEIIARTISAAQRRHKFGNQWQYLSRGDHHSKVACWAIIFDLMLASQLLCRHISSGAVVFGINHEMRDFVQDRKKDLDLVLGRPTSVQRKFPKSRTLQEMVKEYAIVLTEEETVALERLPELRRADVSSVLMALEAKACMTAHQRALPRLYDELNSSHLTVHGANTEAIAAGFAMVNAAVDYLSPDLNKANRVVAPLWSQHGQPRDAQLAVEKVRQLPRRSSSGQTGYDAFSIVVIDCSNDGRPVSLVTEPPSPPIGDIYNYEFMIDRMAHSYATRFKEIA
jgi:hypothetical protein